MISSRSNSLVKEYRKFKRNISGKERKVIIEGIRLIEEAQKTGAHFEALFFIPDLADEARIKLLIESIRSRGVKCEAVSHDVMESLSLEPSPPGIWALVVPHELPLFDDKNVLVFCDLQDPGNAGSLIRVAEGVNCAVWFSEQSVHPFHPKVVKGSMGSVFRLPIQQGPLIPFLQKLKGEKVKLIAAQTLGGTRYKEMDWQNRFALLLGNEGAGLPREVIDYVDEFVQIPLEGEVESLNVAVAGGILLFEAKAQLRH